MYKTAFEFYMMCIHKNYFDMGCNEQYEACGELFEQYSKIKHDSKNSYHGIETLLHELSAMVWICSSSSDTPLEIYNNIIKIL